MIGSQYVLWLIVNHNQFFAFICSGIRYKFKLFVAQVTREIKLLLKKHITVNILDQLIAFIDRILSFKIQIYNSHIIYFCSLKENYNVIGSHYVLWLICESQSVLHIYFLWEKIQIQTFCCKFHNFSTDLISQSWCKSLLELRNILLEIRNQHLWGNKNKFEGYMETNYLFD